MPLNVRMRRQVFLVFTFFSSLVSSLAGVETNLAAISSPLERGRYLVESVTICADCHTERDWFGNFKREKWLHGAKLEFKPARLMPWADFAPSIAGLPQFTNDAAAVTYFMTGKNAAGRSSNPPMPQYRLTREDAEAVVAYLRALPAPKKK